MRYSAVIPILMMLALAVSRAAAQAAPLHPDTPPAWLYPGAPAPDVPPDTVTPHHLPHSTQALTLPQVSNPFAPADWQPKSHPALPVSVAYGRTPDVIACGYCHLPNGIGRPENAALAGLPEGYIIAQVQSMRKNVRQNARPDWRPTVNMHKVALAARIEEVATAAQYFSSLPYHRAVTVVESAEVPKVREAGFVHVPIRGAGAGKELIGERILETPASYERFELRDPDMTYTAYVPPGSIARGATIAKTGGAVTIPCAGCHGPALQGNDSIPPLAGRYPSYLVRQLLAFKHGIRGGIGGQTMAAVTARMDLGDLIAAAAYAGSLRP